MTNPQAIVAFDRSVPANALFSKYVARRLSRWARLARVGSLFTRRGDYAVRFTRRLDIFDLVECTLTVAIGSASWTGSSLGVDTPRAFESVFREIPWAIDQTGHYPIALQNEVQSWPKI